MPFDAELRAYLEVLQRTGPSEPARADGKVDRRMLRAHLLSRLQELETVAAGTHATAAVQSLFDQWSPQLAGFARYVEGLSDDVVVHDARAPLQLALDLLDVALGFTSGAGGFVQRLEMERVVGEFLCNSEIEAYALETRLVEQDASGPRRTTALGSAFLRLRGRDAVRWLLTIELLQSTGRRDPWRVSRELLEEALNHREIVPTYADDDEHRFSFATQSLLRLCRMGVLTATRDGGEIEGFELVEDWGEEIGNILAPTHWHHVIAAVLSEDRTGLVPTSSTATEGIIEHGKMIAHEVRNALVPARIQLDALRAEVPEAHIRRIEAARRGVTRVLGFVEDMVATNELVTELVTACELGELVREAISWLDGSERISVVAAPARLRVRASRAQLARAIANLLRNALQVTRDSQAVQIAVQERGSRVRVVVDDAGPGVPEDMRERVFHEGFTTRADGSGYGLYQVRRVVVDGLRGRVWCEASDLGGARFVIELPEVEIER